MKHQYAGQTPVRRAVPVGLLILLTLASMGSVGAEPLSLDDCVELGLANNPGLAAAKHDLNRVKGNKLSASAAFLPSLSAQSGFSHSETGPGSFVFEGVTFPIAASKQEYYSIRTNLNQNLIHLPSLYRYRAAGADVNYSTESMRASKNDLIYQIRQQYYLLLGAILLGDVAKDALAVSEEQLRKSEALFELGSVARTDVLQARVNRATAVQEEINARNSIAQERARLAVALGLDVGEPLEIRLDVDEPSDMEPPDEESLIEEALSARPEVRRAKAQLKGADLRKSAAFWDQFPTLSGNMSYSKQGDRFSDVVDTGRIKDDASWGFSIGLSWNIFDGFGTIGGIKSANASAAAAREEYRRQELETALGVREARIEIKNAGEGIRAASEAVELASENLKLQEALYENGGGTILELNNAQVENTRARNSLIEARISLHLAYALLDRAMGR